MTACACRRSSIPQQQRHARSSVHHMSKAQSLTHEQQQQQQGRAGGEEAQGAAHQPWCDATNTKSKEVTSRNEEV